MLTDDNNFEKIQELLDYLMVEFPDGSLEHKYVADSIKKEGEHISLGIVLIIIGG